MMKRLPLSLEVGMFWNEMKMCVLTWIRRLINWLVGNGKIVVLGVMAWMMLALLLWVESRRS
jgi:hypothetical protein